MAEQNMGSFGAALGGADALKAAMQKRGMDASVLDQVSASAPTGPSPVAPNIPAGASSPAGTMAEQAVGQPAPEAPAAPNQMPRSAEMDIALKALAGTVKTENKIAEASLGLR